MGDEGSIRRVYEMVRVLHERGYERLRVVPGMSPSGMHYRVPITFAANVSAKHGARAVDGRLVAPHSSANGSAPFGWADAANSDAERLADLFIERFAPIASRGLGSDPTYAAWYRDEVLPAIADGRYPVAYADYDLPAPDGFMAAANGRGGVALPPPPPRVPR